MPPLTVSDARVLASDAPPVDAAVSVPVASAALHHGALRNWIRRTEADAGERTDRPGWDVLEENRRPAEVNAGLRPANETLPVAGAHFGAELGPTRRRS